MLRLEQVDASGVESPVLIRLPGWQLGLEAVAVGQLFPGFFLQGAVTHVHHPGLPALLELAEKFQWGARNGCLDGPMYRRDAAVHQLKIQLLEKLLLHAVVALDGGGSEAKYGPAGVCSLVEFGAIEQEMVSLVQHLHIIRLPVVLRTHFQHQDGPG